MDRTGQEQIARLRGNTGAVATVKLPVYALLMILLAGCQSQPSDVEKESQTCPSPEPVACPVCEITQCPEPVVIEKEVIKYVPAPVEEARADIPNTNLPVIGAIEWAKVEPSNLVLEARIDTGAETSSIHAEDIVVVEKDGKRYIRFSLLNPDNGAKVPLERRLHRTIVVKQKDAVNVDRRYVVRMWMTMGATRTWVDVSLSDREEFEFPLLVGRNMLVDSFIVDTSQHHTLPKIDPEGQ